MKKHSILIIFLCSIFFVCDGLETPKERQERKESKEATKQMQLYLFFGPGGPSSNLPSCSRLTPVTEVQTGQVITDANNPRTPYLLWKNIPVNAKMVLTNNLTDPRCVIQANLYTCNILGFYQMFAPASATCPNLGSGDFVLNNSNRQITCILSSNLYPNTGNSLYFNVSGSFFANNQSNFCSFKLELTQ